MSSINRSLVTLIIVGDDLIPSEITKLLGTNPTYACTKGQRIVGPKTGKVRITKSGIWNLKVANRKPEDLDGQIHEIFSRLPADLSVWQSITKKYRVNLSCGLFMSTTNDGLSLSPHSLAILAERGIELWFDIYAPPDDDEPIS